MKNENKYILNAKQSGRLAGRGLVHSGPIEWNGSSNNSQLDVKRMGYQEESARMVGEEAQAKYKNVGSNLKYLTVSNPKTQRGLAFGYITAILHLAPANYGGYTTCHRFKECATTCLYHQGRGRFPSVANARIRKTKQLFEERESFFMGLHTDISALLFKLRGKDAPKLCVRLNGTSDICWEDIRVKAFDNKTIFDAFPTVEFYDYTKYKWNTRTAWDDMPMNYHLTYSFDGTEADVANANEVLKNGWNVNIIHTKSNYKRIIAKISEGYKIWGYPVFDNELNDLRFLDARPMVLIGKEKGYSNIAI